MPELPEVESIRHMLAKRILNKRISNVDIIDGKTVAMPDSDSFKNRLFNREILSIDREGKYLIFGFDEGRKLVVHLRMTGNLIYSDSAAGVSSDISSDENCSPKHVRVVFTLTDKFGKNQHLYFCDQRKFGRMWFYDDGEDYRQCGIDRLGAEPLSIEFSKDYLYERTNRTQRAIKTVLLDQSVISGIGNIYADESLFEAKILPQTAASELRQDQICSLHDAINKVIERAIDANLCAIEAYMQGASNQYSDLEKMYVYQKYGRKCKLCGTIIKKLTISGRSSCFCPRCQR